MDELMFTAYIAWEWAQLIIGGWVYWLMLLWVILTLLRQWIITNFKRG